MVALKKETTGITDLVKQKRCQHDLSYIFGMLQIIWNEIIIVINSLNIYNNKLKPFRTSIFRQSIGHLRYTSNKAKKKIPQTCQNNPPHVQQRVSNLHPSGSVIQPATTFDRHLQIKQKLKIKSAFFHVTSKFYIFCSRKTENFSENVKNSGKCGLHLQTLPN